MFRPWRLALAGGLTLFVGLLLFFPARVAYQWFVPPVVKASGFSGTMWNGTALEANVGGIYVRDLSWNVEALRLFTGQLAVSVTGRPAGGFFEGRVALGATGTISISDLRGSLSLHTVRDLVGNPGLGGDISVRIDTFRVVDGQPESGSGDFEVANLTDSRLLPQPIGGYRGTLTTEGDVLLIRYEDTDGVIDIDGRIELASSGHYVHTARMREKSSTPQDIRNFIRFQPEAADGSGWREARLGEGQL